MRSRILVIASSLAAFAIALAVSVPAFAQTTESPVENPHLGGAKLKKKTKKKAPPKKKKKNPPKEEPPKVEIPPAEPPKEELVTTAEPPKPEQPPFTPKEVDKEREDVVAKQLRGERGTWLGVRYTAMMVPPFLSGLAVYGAPTLLFHGGGLELELERNRIAILLALQYTNLSAGPMAVRDPNPPVKPPASDVGYVSYVDAKLHALSFTADVLFAMSKSKAVSLEAGAGLGAGFVFGSLAENWVYEDPKGSLSIDQHRYSPCKTQGDGVGCRPQDHAVPLPAKVYVGGNPHQEGSWLDKGHKPLILPYLVLPELALRVRPSDGLAFRLTAGASVTGFFARISGSFRLGE